MLDNIKDYRNFNNTQIDNETLKSIAELNNEFLDNTLSKFAALKNNDVNNTDSNDNNTDNNTNADNDVDNNNADADNDSTELKTYSNLDLTRQVLQKVREYMKAEKMSMSEFARQTGVSKAWLSKLKHTDANLSLNTAQDLLHYMGYTLRLTREGSITINKSRIKKYACKNLTKEDVQPYISLNNKNACKNLIKEDITAEGQQTKYVVGENQQTRYVTAEGQQTKYVVGENQQIAPTPSSTQQTQTSTITTTPAVSTVQTTTPAPTTPVKLNPGQTVTISASRSVPKEQSFVERETISASRDTSISASRSVPEEQLNSIKKVANVKGVLNNKTLSNDEINLLYTEEFFSTPIKSIQINKK